MIKKKTFKAWFFLFVLNGFVVSLGLAVLINLNISESKKATVSQSVDNMKIFSESVYNMIKNIHINELDNYVKNIASSNKNFRISIIDSKGFVIADSDAPSLLELENHLWRQEIKSAFASESGIAIRHSTVNNKDVLYYAFPINIDEQKYVMRLSMPIETNIFFSSNIALSFAITGIIVLLLILIFSFLISLPIVKGIDELIKAVKYYKNGKFDYIPKIATPKELQTLSFNIQNMAQTIKTNITQLTQQKDEFEAVFSGITEGLILYDDNNNICECNKMAKKFFSIKEEKIEGKSISQVLINRELIELALKKEKAELTVIIKKELFEDLILTAKCIPIITSNYKIRYLLVLQDVSKVYKLQKMRKDFVANVSHELKTPVTSIRGFSETLLDGAYKNPEVSLDFIQIINQQSYRLENIITDLLTLSNLEQEEKSLELINLNVSEIVNNVCSSYKKDALKKNIKINVNLKADKAFANVSEGLFSQAIGNIIQNAIKYCPENSTIDCLVEKIENNIRIFIEDNGSGIAPQYKKRIFERFFRIDKGRSREMGGTGLGLSIANHIIKAHKGIIKEVGRSDKKSGAGFEILIPSV